MALPEEQSQLDTAIWQALLAALPEQWASASLTCSTDGEIEDGIAHSIQNLDEEPDICVPSDEIYGLTKKHYDAFTRNGTPWRKVTWSIRFDFDDENWKCTTDLEY